MAAPPAVIGRAARPVAGVSAGLLVAFSMPPWGFWPLAFAGVALFEWALGDSLGRAGRAAVGFGFGVAWMYTAMAWMWFLTVPGYIVSCALFAGLHALAAAFAPGGRWRTIGRPAAHTLVEVVRCSFPFGGVPLATLGISQAGGPLLGLARVGGVVLITWVVLQVGFALAGPLAALPGLVRRRVAIGDHRHGWAALAAIAVLVVLAAVAPDGSAASAPPLRIAAVQGGGRQGTSALDVPSSAVTEAHLDATATIARDPGLGLVVWPENGIDVDRRPFDGSRQQLAVAQQAARLGVPFAIGVTVDSEFSRHPVPDRFVNAQVVVTPDGDVISSYEKVRIVPFGEFVPLRGLLEAAGVPLDQIPSDAISGRDPAVIELPDGTELGVMISWEVFFGDRGRAAADGAILLNPTNGASYTGTILQTQQVASSKLRAVETGRWVVQVSPTGFSAFVSSSGEVFQRTGVSERRVIVMDVPLRTGTTWYTATGDRLWVAAVLALLAGAWWLGEWRPRRAAATVTPVTPA
ncbi:MAG TPA: apolipoprotein N-acyltransferase [Ilumatobacter sp.]